jgi:hypothetical protein
VDPTKDQAAAKKDQKYGTKEYSIIDDKEKGAPSLLIKLINKLN